MTTSAAYRRIDAELHKLEAGKVNPKDVPSILRKIYKYSEPASFERAECLKSRYQKLVNPIELADVLDKKIDYVLRIIDPRLSTFEFEEMFQVFWILDNVFLHERIGIYISEEKKILVDNTLKIYFKKYEIHYRDAAKQLLEDWNSDFWWYDADTTSTS